MSKVFRAKPEQKGKPGAIEKIVVGTVPVTRRRDLDGRVHSEPVAGWEPPVIARVMASDGLKREEAIALCVDWQPQGAKASAKDTKKTGGKA